VHPPTLSLPPTTAPDHPQSLPPSHQRLQLRSQWHPPSSLSCRLQKAGEEGSAKVAGFIGCVVPRQRTPSTSAGRQRYRATERVLSKSEIQSSRSFTTFLKNFTYSICSKPVGVASLSQQREGLLDQPRQAVENPPYGCRISPFTEPQITPHRGCMQVWRRLF
jgi:hypothetical protein